MESIVTRAAITKIRGALADLSRIRVTSYRLGIGVDIPLNDGDVSDVAGFIHGGVSGQPGAGIIRARPFSDDQVRFTLTLNDRIGDFAIGNVMLFLDDGTPFIFGTLRSRPDDPSFDVKLNKVRRLGPENLGNFVVINFTVKITNVATVLNVDVLFDNLGDECTARHAQTQYQLPDATDPNDIVVVDTFVGTPCCPTIAFKPTGSTHWYGPSIIQRLDDLSWGILDGGLTGLRRGCDIRLDYGTFNERARDVRTPGVVYMNMDFDGGNFGDPADLSDVRFRCGEFTVDIENGADICTREPPELDNPFDPDRWPVVNL